MHVLRCLQRLSAAPSRKATVALGPRAGAEKTKTTAPNAFVGWELGAFQDELILEGALHVAPGQVAACRLAQPGLDAATLLLAPAPDLAAANAAGVLGPPASSSILEALKMNGSGSSSSSEGAATDSSSGSPADAQQHRLAGLALCLAMPPDAPEGESETPGYGGVLRLAAGAVGNNAAAGATTAGAQQPAAAAAGSALPGRLAAIEAQRAPPVGCSEGGGSSSAAAAGRGLCALAQEELLLLEAAAWEHAHLWCDEASTAHALRAAAAVSRRRRRALLRALLRGRNAASNVLQHLTGDYDGGDAGRPAQGR